MNFIDDDYEPFEEVDIEGGRNDREDTDLFFISQIL